MPEIGQTVSHYRIVEKIGQGGMGEVYLADDTTLDRKVALKFLPEAFTSDPERMARFEREAKLLASLNHPNIAGIHGLEQSDGNRFLVLEYVEGETLQARLSKGALPLEDALAICRQIAEGLEAAHEKGVIHRDLKPANVMITGEEKVKILDFGLAKALADETQTIDSSQSPTITEAMTRPGVVLGTAAYMSPEQAKGKSVDKRADIWAFGCILYECLTGKKAFEGETVTETLAAVIKEELDFVQAPAKVQMLLRNCLAKNPKNRLRDIGDTMILLTIPEATLETMPVKHSKLAWIWAAIATLLVVILMVSGFFYFKDNGTSEVIRLNVDLPTNILRIHAISPDGRQIAFVGIKDGKSLLFLRSLAELEHHTLPGTEDAMHPFWSPDGRYIGFGAEGKLKKINTSAGYPETLCDLPEGILFRGGTWSPDGVILFTGGKNSLYRIPEDGDTPVAVTEIDTSRRETSHRFPSFLPDGRYFLYTVRSLLPENHGIYLGSIDSDIKKRVINVLSNAVLTEQGFLLFVRNGKLVAHRFDQDRLEAVGDSITIIDQIGDPFVGYAAFTVSQNDRLVYQGTSGEDVFYTPLIWMNRNGIKTGEVDFACAEPALSPKGHLIAATRYQKDTDSTDIWLIDSSRHFNEPLTHHAGWDQHPIWSPDGKHIVFSSNRDNAAHLIQVSVDDNRSEVSLHYQKTKIRATDWSPDGRYILYRDDMPGMNTDLCALPLFGDKKPFQITNSEFTEAQGRVSPDGNWIAFSSDDAGQVDIYIQRFPSAKQRWRVTIDGGSDPKWRQDSKELFYLAADGRMMAVPVTLGDIPDFGTSVELFDAKTVGISREVSNYDVSDDGRFLLQMPSDRTYQFIVILNWTALLE